jgi:peroxiredoxin
MPKSKPLNFNHSAPDFTLQSVTGESVQLSSLWAQKPLLLAFTRHSGCTQCKEMLEQLVFGRERIEKSGLAIAVIMQGTLEIMAGYAKEYAPGLLCLLDPERQVYQAYGLERGNLFQTFLNPKVWAAVSRSGKKGYKVEPPPSGQDAMQMSGIFIVSKEGRIELPYYFDHIADHPSLDLLLDGVLSTDWDRPFDGPIGPGVDTKENNAEKKQ